MRSVTFSDGRTRPLGRPPISLALPGLLDERIVLMARLDALDAAWRAEEPPDGEDDDDAPRWVRLGTLRARVIARIGGRDAHIAAILDGAGRRACWHRGWLVECQAPQHPPRPRVRLTGCPPSGLVAVAPRLGLDDAGCNARLRAAYRACEATLDVDGMLVPVAAAAGQTA